MPKSLLDSNVLKRKDLKRLLNQNLDWFFEKNFLNKDDIKSEYLKCMNELLQFSGRIYLVTLIVSSPARPSSNSSFRLSASSYRHICLCRTK